MDRKRPRIAVIVAAALWDTAWKFVAVRRAIRVRQFGWIAPLLVVNSVGLLPMVYLWKLSKREASLSD